MKKTTAVVGTLMAAMVAVILYLRWRSILSIAAGVVLAVPVGGWLRALSTHTGIPEVPPIELMYLVGGISVSWLTFILLPSKTGRGEHVKKG